MQYTYPLTTVSSGVILPKRLHLELDALIPGAVCDGVTVVDPNIYIDFAEVLTTEQVATVLAVLTAHTGTAIPNVVTLAASRLVDGEKIITNTSEWQTIAGTLANPSHFSDDMSEIAAQVIGQASSKGTGAELRLLELDPDIDMINPVYIIPDTDNAWLDLSILTNQVPTGGTKLYVLQARLGAASSLVLRYMTMTLLKIS